MSRATVLAALLAVTLGATPGFAERPLALPAPDFPKGLPWINSPELSLRGLKGNNVTVVAFIGISASNSMRVLRRLEDWSKRYSKAGLIVIAIHTPDFEFEKDPAVVRAELQRRGVTIPVVLDNDRALWKAYQVQGWPSFFLVDPKGRIVFDRLGEGRFQEFEAEIIGALEHFSDYSPKGYWPSPDAVDNDCGKATKMSYLGAERGRSRGWTEETGRAVIASRDGELVYRGKWEKGPESLLSKRASTDGSDYLRLIYRGAASMMLARASNAKPVSVYVKQDDFWIDEKNAGPDIRFDRRKHSYVVVSASRFYGLTRNASDEEHELMMYPAARGLEVYAFDFADACQVRVSR